MMGEQVGRYVIIYRHSLWTLAPTNLISLSLSVPLLRLIISLTMGWILIKHGENVGTSVRLIVLKFNKIGLVLT